MAVSFEAQPARAKATAVSPHHEDRAAMVPPVSAPQRVAPNRQAMHRLTHHCNCNDLNSMFEIVAGELRAKLLSRQGLAGFRDNALSHAQQHKRRRCGGRRRDRRAPAPGTQAVPHSNNTGRGRRAGGQAALRPEICRGTSDSSRIYSPARRSTSCMMRPHTALTHATAATPRTRERQGRTCRKSSKP